MFKKLFARTGKTPKQFAKEVGVSDQTVHNWLNGTKPRMKRFVSIAKALSTELDTMTSDDICEIYEN